MYSMYCQQTHCSSLGGCPTHIPMEPACPVHAGGFCLSTCDVCLSASSPPCCVGNQRPKHRVVNTSRTGMHLRVHRSRRINNCPLGRIATGRVLLCQVPGETDSVAHSGNLVISMHAVVLPSPCHFPSPLLLFHGISFKINQLLTLHLSQDQLLGKLNQRQLVVHSQDGLLTLRHHSWMAARPTLMVSRGR